MEGICNHLLPCFELHILCPESLVANWIACVVYATLTLYSTVILGKLECSLINCIPASLTLYSTVILKTGIPFDNIKTICYKQQKSRIAKIEIMNYNKAGTFSAKHPFSERRLTVSIQPGVPCNAVFGLETETKQTTSYR
ncbi:hypothetical protein CEXT_282011 [Caerostris extrusa]|uniref:Uncharacterized protein n=1 Tax=Caerostris extrusa TaxID=172846 RepID=A0AAV4MU45_CAEEX|nr:hypothetical protein CEXT_282011 [Caerostris extrusa]